MLENYLPVLIFLAIGTMAGIGLIFLGGYLLAPHKPDEAKNSPFECGFEAFEDSRMKFDVRYYLVAILFYYLRFRNRFSFSMGHRVR